MSKTITTAAIAAMLLTATAALAADPAPTCEASKLGTSAKYAQCRLKADSKAAKAGTTADYSKCNLDKFVDAEGKAGPAVCPSEGDQASIQEFLDACTDSVDEALGGGTLPLDVTTCNTDLADCESRPVCGDGLVTGEEQCDDGDLAGATCATRATAISSIPFAGGALACSFCTFDESGCYTTRFDASGATIIDHQTGLEWEKKTGTVGADSFCPNGANCADPHDVNNRYQWSNTGTAPDGPAFTDFLARLNGGFAAGPGPTTGCFAGHCDWRLPKIEELSSLPWPAGSEFQPDAASAYWSLTSASSFPSPSAWNIETLEGSYGGSSKLNSYSVRAVRSGS